MEIDNRLTKEQIDQKVKEVLDVNPEDIATEENESEGLENTPEQQEEEKQQEVQEPTQGVEEEQALPDVEERYKESSREATSLYFKNKKLTDTIVEAETLPEPSEEELREYSKEMGEDFDNLDVFAKNLLKSSLINERRFSKINAVVAESQKIEQWVSKVETFATDEKTLNKYPSLANNTEEFKKYASREQRRGMDLEDLVASFLFNLKSRPARTGNKSLLLDGGNGRNQPPRPAKMDDTDAIALRNRDQKAYKRAIKEGKIEIDF